MDEEKKDAKSFDSQIDTDNKHNDNLCGTEQSKLDEKDMRTYDRNAKENEEKANCKSEVERVQDSKTPDVIIQGTRLCEPCLFDETEENAVSFCIICIEYLCSGCARGHRRSKMTRDHRVLNENEMPKDSQIFKLMKSTMSCSDHPEMDVSYKCEQHGTFICTKCLAVNHRKCEEVQDISAGSMTTTSEIAVLQLKDELKSTYDKTVSVRIEKEDNIKKLHIDLTEVLKEQSAFIQKLQKQLLSQGVKAKKETASLFETEVARFNKEVEECKKIESLETEYKELFDVAVKYGSIVEQCVVSSMIHKKINLLNEKTEKYAKIPPAHLVFRQSQELAVMTSIGKVFVTRDEKKRDFLERNLRKQSTYECSSDALETNNGKEIKTSNITLKKKPLMQSTVRQTGKYDIQQKATEVVCCATRILILPDGCIIVADYENRKIKVLNTEFCINFVYKVDKKPKDLCQTSGNKLAVIYDGVKIINRLNVDGEMITDCGHFPTKLFPVSIDSSPERGDQVVILFSDVQSKTLKRTDFVVKEVQIRSVKDGEVLKQFTALKNLLSSKLVLEDASRIRFTPKQQNTFLLSGRNKLYCVESGANKNELKGKWFFQSHGNNIVDGISDITTDREGNIYVCGRGSKNIHQISGNNFMQNRVIATVSGNPLSIGFDDDKRLLLIACENDNFIYVASFT